MRRTSRTLLSLLVLAACTLVLPAAEASVPACASAGGAMEYITPRTFHVQIKPLKKTYRRGEVVKVKVLVTRPAEEDPAGLGVPLERPASVPAEGVNVGVGISVGRVFLPGYGRTSPNGVATVGIKLARYVPSAPADVRAFAYKEVVATTCLTVEEQGFKAVENAFRVK